MAKLTYFLLVATFGVALASPQRNLPFPTTRRPGPGSNTTPAPNNPTTSWTPSTTAWTPTSSSWSPSTTPFEASGYPSAGFRPGRAFDLPTEERKAEEPGYHYGPPADKYGPPEEQTTTIQPELEGSGNDTTTDNTTAKIPKGLEPGFYFIQLPGGGIQKIALLTNAALVQLPTTNAALVQLPTAPEELSSSTEEDDTIEPTTTSPSTAQSQHVQPIANTRTVQVWPAVPQVVSVQPVVDVQPVVVESAKLVKPLRSQPLVNVEPVLYFQPKSYSYSSQFRTW